MEEKQQELNAQKTEAAKAAEASQKAVAEQKQLLEAHKAWHPYCRPLKGAYIFTYICIYIYLYVYMVFSQVLATAYSILR